MRLSGQVAIVTGGARGIGAAISNALNREGAHVAVVDIDFPAVQVNSKPSQEVRNIQTHAIACDISDPAQVGGMVNQVLAHFGKIDILVNNAGICPLTPFESISPLEWDKVLNINLKGAFLCCQCVIRPMQTQGYGRVINISSVAGKMGGVLVGAHYAASKAGLIALTFSLARGYASKGITANVIAPATVDTEMIQSWPEANRSALINAIPLGRLGLPQDVAEAVVFLASKEAGFITGEVLDVNGGFLMD